MLFRAFFMLWFVVVDVDVVVVVVVVTPEERGMLP